MNKSYPFGTKAVWKGSLILISYFLLAACMQHDESLAPQGLQTAQLSALNSEAGGKGSMMKRTFTAHLTADNELPSGSVESQAQGQAIFTVSKDGTTVHYKLIVANIKNVIMAHIHCGAADQGGATDADGGAGAGAGDRSGVGGRIRSGRGGEGAFSAAERVGVTGVGALHDHVARVQHVEEPADVGEERGPSAPYCGF